jgi:hypothetical protein
MIKLKIEAFDSGMKPLMRHQKPYFAGHESAVIKSLLNLRSQTSGNPIAHVVVDALLDFIDMVESDLATSILLKYVDPYVEERNRYDETQSTRQLLHIASVVLTLKCLAVLIRKLSMAQIDFNMPQLAALTITVLLFVGWANVRLYMMMIRRSEDKVWRCVFRYSSSCKMNKRCLMLCGESKRILVNRIFCIIISNMPGDKVKNRLSEEWVYVLKGG